MRNLKRILLGVFLLLMVLVVLAFVLENQQSVALLFLGFPGRSCQCHWSWCWRCLSAC